ncbi:carbohydrate ABC transporter permease [Demequina sp. SYSU T00039]|uniref:Carbohydrate ABC transporter permease n=1 Tax=Demequina lignilytica TaxID=3051663 RepID=A0AAW7M6B8_9MICO|nr:MULTISPECIES: carbohydrate ABC transporter permease [unclassified Demequina]MDN4477862.1 carbohydrate ABC transporter permease [Demequina sp. SYSU T00039-1]MDN4487771.1 carbohydrate ABC transporter permease [Demequina sp. SYSU T00039]MDN4490846.1 carbohydrate ABC transporter permease [Demequina sp. SYSU T00068]
MTTPELTQGVHEVAGLPPQRPTRKARRSTGDLVRHILGRATIYALLIIGSLAALLPLFWMVSTSFKANSEVFKIPATWIPEQFTFEYYAEALLGTSPNFIRFFFNTMILELLIIVGTLLTSLLAAYAFSRVQWRGRDLVFGATLATMMVPFAVTLVPLFIGWSKVGAIDTFWPLALPAWFGGGAFNIFLLRQFMMQIPKDFDEAAQMDGASHWYILRYIIMPMVKPALLVVAIFTFIGVWNDFLGPLIYLTSNDNYTIALGLTSFKQTYGTQWNLLMAASVATILPIVIVLFTFQKPIIEGANLNPGLKG